MSSKVCLIGLDCVPPELLFDRWRHDLPNLDRLMSSGQYGLLESTVPPITVPAWMCMMTGKDPGTLGIYGFRNRANRSYGDLAMASSRDVREEPVWDILARNDKRSILLGIPLTYPPRPINGLMVCDFLAPDTESEYTYPPELAEEIRSAVGEYVLDVRDFREMDKDLLLAAIDHMTDQRFKLARYLVTTKQWDFFAMVEMGADRMHHAFWRYMDPEHRLHEPANPYKNAIHDYYVRLDSHVGQLVDSLPPDTLILVVSDHGAKRMDGAICINEWLIREGYLSLNESTSISTSNSAVQTEVTKLDASMIDWSRTKAWGEGGYFGRLFLNVDGREPAGIVPPVEVDALRAEIAVKLEALSDEHGRPLGNRVYWPERIYRSVNRIPLDLIIYFGDLHWRSAGTIGHGTIWIYENDTGPDDANHAQYGIAIISALDDGRWTIDDSFEPSSIVDRPSSFSIYDIAPTILRAFGIDPPPGVGRSAPTPSSSDSVYTEEEEAELARRLEDLGYL